MIDAGRIEDLKVALRDEIFTESLKNKPGVKKRYAAMKKYFTYVTSVREAMQKPSIVEFEGKPHTSFCNSYSLVLTTETCGEIELFDKPESYPDVVRLLRFDGTERKVDFNKVFALAKSMGYKLKKSEVGFDYKYLIRYDGAYFKVGLIESTYGIINDGEAATVYHVDGDYTKPLVIRNDIGVCLVMPMKYEEDGTKIIIDVEAE